MKSRFGCFLALAAFGLDRVTKLWAQQTLQPGVRVQVLPGLLHFLYVENTGAAFSILQGQRWLLLVITGGVIVCSSFYLLFRPKALSPLTRVAAWLLLGGAAGNFFDRAVHGAVTDFLEFGFMRFPVFNVADCFVTIAFLFLAFSILQGEKERKQENG